MNNKKAGLIILVFGLGMLLASQAMAAFQQEINYQGKLTDASNIPVADGSYGFVFKIWDDPTAGSDLWTETQSGVSVESGFFNVILGSVTPIGFTVFTDEARYLGIKVGTDAEMTPRQKLVAVGSAFYAYNADKLDGHDWSEVPVGGNFVAISGDTMTDTLTVESSGFRAIYANASATGAGIHYAGHFQAAKNSGRGVFAEATATGSITNYGGYFTAAGDNGRGIYAYGSGSSGWGVSGSGGSIGGYFSTAGSTGRAVYGYATASGSGTNYGGMFTADKDTGRGIYASVSGSDAAGVYGTASHTSGTNYGGYFHSSSSSGRGVYGTATATGSATNYGGNFEASGDSGRGVLGQATATGAVTNYGGYFTAAGDSGRAIYGLASGASGYGVWGQGTSTGDTDANYGGVFTAGGGAGVAVSGIGGKTGNFTSYGGIFEAKGDTGVGVEGRATGTGGVNYGVYGTTSSSTGYAGYFTGGLGVKVDGDLVVTGTIEGASPVHISGGLNVFGGPIIPEPCRSFGVGDTTPSVTGGNFFDDANLTGVTTITAFTGGEDGQSITIVCTQNRYLYITDGGDIKLSSTFTGTTDDTITLIYHGTSGDWYEVSRSAN